MTIDTLTFKENDLSSPFDESNPLRSVRYIQHSVISYSDIIKFEFDDGRIFIAKNRFGKVGWIENKEQKVQL